MRISPTLLFRLLLASFFLGILLGVLYDTMRITRVIFGVSRYGEGVQAPKRPPNFWVLRRERPIRKWSGVAKYCLVFAQDFFFCIAAGCGVALLLFSHNDGEFRGFVLLGSAVGFLAYYFTVGRLVVRISEYLVFAIKTFFLYAVYYVTWPFITAVRFSYRHIASLFFKIRKKHSEKRIDRYTKKQRTKLSEQADAGFLPRSCLAGERTF